ncbi:LOW QUALITY PROTEIN: hypothetical protein PFAG_04068 [Plasmodium falciparum Santa Lucia]|uniref:Uncharacterized protein n=2 Tax=Plasmodium falciparum TaxID=5833 RepID=W4J1K3_PLAFP|nr:LOW QUALITY PROTEIN: hypothetical protein PFUGPA_02129 [Plasmodium falciparum Palo Alto/Uganda]EUT82220.1 LOW QUALITY PROTEIN: hypothetical protein PFAG_04068 [Plasmodium falciparum Santa Lucia]
MGITVTSIFIFKMKSENYAYSEKNKFNSSYYNIYIWYLCEQNYYYTEQNNNILNNEQLKGWKFNKKKKKKKKKRFLLCKYGCKKRKR